jgi:hypothetical protein
MSIPEAIVALTGIGLEHLNTLQPFEVRSIVLAQGKQFRNEDPAILLPMPASLRLPGSERVKVHPKMAEVFPAMRRMPAIPLVDQPDGSFQFFNAKQGVLFTIKVINTKTDFIKTLLTPEVHLIYAGHARYGRGPCFGSGGDSPGEEWEEGNGPHPNNDGIFRLGFPFIGVPVGELFEHGYTANLTKSDVTLAAADCEPDLRSQLGSMHRRTLATIADRAVKTNEFTRNKALSALTSDQVLAGLTTQVRNADLAATYWTFDTGNDLNVVHIAGFENTLSTPDDLGAITPLCRVFSHFGCSTFHHNFPVVRKLKGWKREGNERYAYWTTDIANFVVDMYWLQNLLTFDKFNANQPLAASLDHAVRATNANLAQDRQTYRVI